MALDNSLQDCSDLPAGHESETELVQDYKRLVLKCPNHNKQRRKCLAAPGKPRVLLYSRDIGERENETDDEPDWNLISSAKCGENAFVALVTVNGQLMRMSVKLRLNIASNSPINTPVNVNVVNDIEKVKKTELEMFCEVATMSGPKCGLGVANLNGKLFVCGMFSKYQY